MTPESLDTSNGRLALSGSLFRQELRPLDVKQAIASGVMGASVPPAIAISASPPRIIAAASAMASNPEGHADEIVAAFAQLPSRSAITLAAPCGREAAQVVGGARSGPWSRTA